jgi:poly(hydroxyalkanoate) granule-associated protein
MSKSDEADDEPQADKSKKKKDRTAHLGEAAHQIWLAGLGAVATAEEEGGKLFRTLVDRGTQFEERVSEPLGKAGGRVREAFSETQRRASQAASGVERSFDEGVGRAMRRLGLPTREELRTLTERIEELASRLDELVDRGASPKSGGKPRGTTGKR